MSNIENGKQIYSSDDGFKLLLHGDDHVKGWNRDYVDGVPTNTWKSCDCGTKQEASQIYPGLREEIRNA